MFSRVLSAVLLVCALSSKQLMAGHKGHKFIWVKDVDHQSRHGAGGDGLCAVAEGSAEGLRKHFYWQKSYKPEAGQCWIVCCRMRCDTLPGRQYHADLMSDE